MLNLSGTWTLTSQQHPEIAVPITIPGDNYHALYQAGIIDDPYYGKNEHQVQWVRECEWTIEREFEISSEQFAHTQLLLKLSRVDTFADIYINEQLVKQCSNIFQHYSIDIKPVATIGVNKIKVVLAPAIHEAKKRADTLPFPIPYAKGNNQVPHMNLVRKTQCHTGWDWGICLPVSGIYDPVFISLQSGTQLKRIDTQQVWANNGSVTLLVNIEHSQEKHAEVTAHFDSQTVKTNTELSGKTQLSFTIETPQLWWPAGYGEQPLYPLTVVIGEDSITKQIGLRKLELNTSEDNANESNTKEKSTGSAMEFRVNDFPITAKGANWIPIDAMPARESEHRYRQLLNSAKDANMNMIRVWGGGQYESDIFYDICDELGLMVWQDMMFSCALYPSTDEFIADVEPEIRQQIQRLKDHPSIALWCGDNEVIGALTWYDESKQYRDRYVVNYDRLSRHLDSVIQQEDSSRTFWPSSPCNGDLDYGDAWHDDNRGDMHFWDVWHSGASFSAYHGIKPRFCSEFGFQSWPSLSEVKQFIPKQDWNITSPTFESHQKNSAGNSIITEMFTRYFRFPENFEQMLYLSQVQQAIAIKTGCEYWRSLGSTCRGMLYWQLNDCWPVSSWSSIEYSGRWKQLHYHAKRFFAPTYTPFVETDEALTLRVSNNRRTKQKISGQIIHSTWQGEILNSWPLEMIADIDGDQQVWSFEKTKLQEQEKQGFFFVEFETEEGLTQNTWFPTEKIKQLPLEKANIKFTIKNKQITVRSDKPAFYVHLEIDGNGRFSDSSFTLLAQQSKIIEYEGDDIESLNNTLRIYDLSNSYR